MHDGTLSNQGLSDVYVQNKGTTTVSNDGKIGKCYYLDGTSYMTLSSNMMEFIKDHPFSYGCWFKTSGLAEGMTLCGILSFTYGCSMYINSDGHLGARIDGGAISQTFSTTPNLFDSKWHHLFLTYDGAIAKLYVDGAVAGNMNIVFKNRYNNIGAIGTEINNSSIWTGKGHINDVRVYDNCLSSKEVKLLSQGLILHYPLNQIDRERNLLQKTNQGKINWDYRFANGENTIDDYNSSGVNAVILTCIAASTSWQYTSYLISTTILNELQANTKYTASFDLFCNVTCNVTIGIRKCESTKLLSNTPSMSYSTTGTWKKMTYTLTTNDLSAGIDNQVFYISGLNMVGYYIIKNLKLVKGETCSNFWTPAWEDSDSWLDTTEYDTSGLCNNGSTILPPPLKKSGSPRYDGCYEFNGKQYIKFSSPYWNGTKSDVHELTINVWFILHSGCGAYCTIYSCYNSPGTGLWLGLNTESNGLWAYQGSVSPNYHKSGTAKLPINTWHMATFVFDNGKSTWYLDGSKVGNDVQWARDYINTTQYLAIGNSYTGTTWNTTFNGCLSDFRLFSTAFSAKDVADLYSVSASVANNGTLLLSGELIEN